jgi:signal transduction histidine kinase
VGSICGDLEDLAQPVTFNDTSKLIYRCRPAGLRRAFRNLIKNAVRYGNQAEVSIQKRHDVVEIIIEDTGPGIPEAMQEKAFAPFYSLEASRNRETGGFGLGLSIARAVIRQHGGDIRFIVGGSGMHTVVSLPLPVSPLANPAIIQKPEIASALSPPL